MGLKLKSKLTGITGELRYRAGEEEPIEVVIKESGNVFSYETLGALLNDWTEFIVREPLIEDEKIRKAVRAWAEAAGATSIVVFDCNNAPCLKVDEIEFAENGGRVSISFKTSEKIDTSKAYTIEELCGEEEA